MAVINECLTRYYDTSDISRLKNGGIVVHFTENANSDAYAHCKYFASADRNAGAHIFVGWKGDIWRSVADKDVAWHCGLKNTKFNNNNTLGIELCCKKYNGVWYFEDATLDSAVEVIKVWMAKYNISVDKVVRHYDVSGKICPEPFVRDKNAWLEFRNRLAFDISEEPNADAVWLRNCTVQQFIETVGPKCTEDQKKNGILACVTLAQAMLESGVGHSELACGQGASVENIKYNGTTYGGRNLFAMKRDISVGTWESTAWKGKTYSIWTSEQKPDGTYVNMYRPFRSYNTIDESIADHSEYLAKARFTVDGKLRYEGIVGETDIEKSIDCLHTGTLEGYATSLDYKKNLIARIEKYGLAAYNYVPETPYEPWYAYVVDTDELNLRESPNGRTNTFNITTLGRIQVIGEEPDSDGDIWYKVKVGASVVGYVWPAFIKRV